MKTHRQIINDMAAAIAKCDGWEPQTDYVDNPHSRAIKYRNMAEAAFEAMTGDRPDYAE